MYIPYPEGFGLNAYSNWEDIQIKLKALKRLLKLKMTLKFRKKEMLSLQ